MNGKLLLDSNAVVALFHQDAAIQRRLRTAQAEQRRRAEDSGDRLSTRKTTSGSNDVPGLSLSPVGGASFAVTPALAVVAQLRAGLMLWEPAVSFAGRHVAGWQGASLLGTVELSWRF